MDKLLALATEVKKNRNQIKSILETPPEVHHFVGEKGAKGLQGQEGVSGVAGLKGANGTKGVNGKDGVSIVDISLDFDNSLTVSLSDGTTIEAGQIEMQADKGERIQTLIRGGETSVSSSSTSGTATIDFGTSNKVAEVVVTGVTEARTTSIVMSQMRVEATTDHSVDDMQIDPIRVLVKDLVVGTGFTLFGAMDNAPANGTYKIDWHLTN